MILFYNKKTGEIIGEIEGRVHDPLVVRGAKISVSGTDDKDIGKYIVPTKPRKQKGRIVELVPDVPFTDKILLFEQDKSEIYKHKLALDKSGQIKGIIKLYGSRSG
jgi:hypothetical protein